MAGWVFTGYPGGSQELFAGDNFDFKQAPCKMVLHSTETDVYPKYAYNKAPHVTANPKGRTWRQHRRLDKPSWSLQAPAGKVSTNSMGAIQVEIIGRAESLKDLDQASLDWLGGLIRFLMQQTGIPMQSSVSFGGAETYGTAGSVRLSATAWTNYRGILGHQHVPNNSHWDPGNLDGSLPFNQSRWFKAIAGITDSGTKPPEPIDEGDGKMLAFGKEQDDPHIWVGDGVTRRWVEDQDQLADLFYKIDTGVFKGDKTVVVSPNGRLGWLGTPVPFPVDVDEAEIAEAVIEALKDSPATLSDADVQKIVDALKNVTYQTKAV